MRFVSLFLLLSLLMLSSCAMVRSAMVTTVDVVSAPFHYLVDDEEDNLDD